MVQVSIFIVVITLILAVLMQPVLAKSEANNNSNKGQTANSISGLHSSGRQLLLGAGKETSTPNFVRLVVMRLIYGIASTMGIEDRLEESFNGAFVPPNAEDGLGLGLGDFGGDEGGGLLDGVLDGGDDIL